MEKTKRIEEILRNSFKKTPDPDLDVRLRSNTDIAKEIAELDEWGIISELNENGEYLFNYCTAIESSWVGEFLDGIVIDEKGCRDINQDGLMYQPLPQPPKQKEHER